MSTVTNVVNLVWSHVYHTEHPPFCSIFAIMQRVTRVVGDS